MDDKYKDEFKFDETLDQIEKVHIEALRNESKIKKEAEIIMMKIKTGLMLYVYDNI